MKIYYVTERKNGVEKPLNGTVYLDKEIAKSIMDDYNKRFEYYHNHMPNTTIRSEDLPFVGRNVYVAETYMGYDYNFGSNPNLPAIYDLIKYSDFRPCKGRFSDMEILSDEEWSNSVFYDCFEDKSVTRLLKFRVDRRIINKI